ncbi:MAG: family 20 glycosylhydrolase [Ginsengibacter sp.]
MLPYIKNKKGFILKIKTVVLLLLFISTATAQIKLPSYPDSIFSTYYLQRVSHFKSLPQTNDDIIFLGNSITDGAEWSELFNDIRVKNRGISGDITVGVINRLDEINNRKPSKVFLLIGVNDLAGNISTDSIVKNILLIAEYIRWQSPSTKLYVQSILPVNNVYGKFATHTNKGKEIKIIDAQLKGKANSQGYTYIDLYSSFVDENGKLKAKLTNDGLHLKGEAYLIWKHIIYPYVYSLQPNPALIPLPKEVNFTNHSFPLFYCKKIVVQNNVLLNEAEKLKQQLEEKGLLMDIVGAADKDEPVIVLEIGKVNAPLSEEEAYHLSVTENEILITANTAHGIYNGIQTLLQLMRDGSLVTTCEIQDWPAFSWRGYMVDVGRNFESVKLLKQQINILGKYKFNIFHFHLTEDIAWRLQSKMYPQLNAPENMLRNKGMYYTEDDLKDLIAYCKERYITLVPEIDMPGHSAAFKRAMGVDMQSDSGIAILKNILKEFFTAYKDVPYFHVGGDEVHISNKNFMPEILKYVESFGKKTIAWSPGAPLDDKTIRQLWMSDDGEKNVSSLNFIDSRHLYLNHIDPLEAPVTIFNRQIGDTTKVNDNMKGGTLCLWPDRRLENEDDVLKMNPVYPGMLSFAERSWRGGGRKGWTATIGAPGSPEANEFAAFENRLLDHKVLYFCGLPFPYLRQSEIVWKLYGPYNNDGEFSKQFAPEEGKMDESKLASSQSVVGGTIILRHWWAPLIKGVIHDPKENTTWYAYTKLWSDEERVQDFWIGFNDLSRSPATDSPKPGTWDDRNSQVSVNGNIIAPPEWQRGGQKGNSEIPLIDEGYEYRMPTKIILHKGWNTVLIKAPVGSFKGKDWQNPVKWMFTFIRKPL